MFLCRICAILSKVKKKVLCFCITISDVNIMIYIVNLIMQNHNTFFRAILFRTILFRAIFLRAVIIIFIIIIIIIIIIIRFTLNKRKFQCGNVSQETISNILFVYENGYLKPYTLIDEKAGKY